MYIFIIYTCIFLSNINGILNIIYIVLALFSQNKGRISFQVKNMDLKNNSKIVCSLHIQFSIDEHQVILSYYYKKICSEHP